MADPGDIARTIKTEWERRARSPDREFFVASHEGWDTEAGREKQAWLDAEYALLFVDLVAAAGQDVLEIGCGSGRLVPYIAPRFRSYTGFDISPTMVDVARARCASYRNARFFESDGTSVPEGARDRSYDFALAAAVLIHCPKDICEKIAASAIGQIRVGGRLRVQLLADITDPEGIVPGSSVGIPDDPGIAERVAGVEHAVTADQQRLISGTHYEGHRFRY